MLHIVIPAAGEGRRFAEAGYQMPKPQVPVAGVPMIDRVVGNLRPADGDCRVTVIGRDDVGATGGAVETILAGGGIGSGPLLLANCDQLVGVTVDQLGRPDLDGCLVTFWSAKPHHSYVLTHAGLVTGIVEKQVVSTRAVAGVYWFADGLEFVAACEKVVADDERVAGETYVSSAVARMLADGARIGYVDAPVAILGTPEELQLFEMAVQVARGTT